MVDELWFDTKTLPAAGCSGREGGRKVVTVRSRVFLEYCHAIQILVICPDHRVLADDFHAHAFDHFIYSSSRYTCPTMRIFIPNFVRSGYDAFIVGMMNKPLASRAKNPLEFPEVSFQQPVIEVNHCIPRVDEGDRFIWQGDSREGIADKIEIAAGTFVCKPRPAKLHC